MQRCACKACLYIAYPISHLYHQNCSQASQVLNLNKTLQLSVHKSHLDLPTAVFDRPKACNGNTRGAESDSFDVLYFYWPTAVYRYLCYHFRRPASCCCVPPTRSSKSRLRHAAIHIFCPSRAIVQKHRIQKCSCNLTERRRYWQSKKAEASEASVAPGSGKGPPSTIAPT